MKTAIPNEILDRKHPHYPTTVRDALRIAWNAQNIGQPTPPDEDLPDIKDALEKIQAMRESAGFNWITGTVAAEVLTSALEEIPRN